MKKRNIHVVLTHLTPLPQTGSKIHRPYTMSLSVTPQPTQTVITDTRDANGNLVMSLQDMGLNGTIRYHRFEDGVKFAQIDVVMAITGKDREYSGKSSIIFRSFLLYCVHFDIRS